MAQVVDMDKEITATSYKPSNYEGAVLGTGDILLRLVSATTELHSCPKLSSLSTVKGVMKKPLYR